MDTRPDQIFYDVTFALANGEQDTVVRCDRHRPAPAPDVTCLPISAADAAEHGGCGICEDDDE